MVEVELKVRGVMGTLLLASHVALIIPQAQSRVTERRGLEEVEEEGKGVEETPTMARRLGGAEVLGFPIQPPALPAATREDPERESVLQPGEVGERGVSGALTPQAPSVCRRIPLA